MTQQALTDAIAALDAELDHNDAEVLKRYEEHLKDTGYLPADPVARGDVGSGNFGHAGRPGQVGGSQPGIGIPPSVMSFSNARTLNSIHKILGPEYGMDDIAKLIGAIEDTKVIVSSENVGGLDRLNIAASNPIFEAPQERIIYKDWDGNLVMANETFFLKDSAPPGTGTKILYREVKALQAAGFKTIYTNGGREDKGPQKLVGYYVWPRLGFDSDIPYGTRRSFSGTPYENYKKVSDFMKTPGGRDAWKRNGVLMGLQFDLTPNSPSMKVLEAYVKAKGY